MISVCCLSELCILCAGHLLADMLITVLVKNKIEYRKHFMTLIQAAVRMWKVRREYLPRYADCDCSVNIFSCSYFAPLTSVLSSAV